MFGIVLGYVIFLGDSSAIALSLMQFYYLMWLKSELLGILTKLFRVKFKLSIKFT